MLIKKDCLFFNGDIPCKPHKKTGTHCNACSEYRPIKEQILIIKLGAAGDVIRTTPILHKIKNEYPNAQITWLTHYPIFVPKAYVHNILKWNLESVLWLQNRNFDLLFNLDKDKEAIALANSINAKKKKGYLIDKFGRCMPADDDANQKWLTGLWDDISKANELSYPEEIMNLCGFEFSKEKYILEIPPSDIRFNLDKSKKIIGLNTGCGTRWLTRLWGKDNWITLANKLNDNGFLPLLLGGAVEDDLNREIAKNSPAKYLGTFKLGDFINLMNQCHLVVTSVTMAMHIAIALEKKLVLFNNIFNRNEFYLYGLGVILEPEGKLCLGCYYNECPEPCMETISPDLVYSEIIKLLQ